jgi:EAL domain-containing protein (putative c-di-GMP-specific phosphodiesterase class I)
MFGPGSATSRNGAAAKATSVDEEGIGQGYAPGPHHARGRALAPGRPLRLNGAMQDMAGQARLGPVDELDLRPAFQPIVDLRDGAVVGYEALMRSGPADGELHSAPALLAAARREDSMLALDLATRDAALRAADRAGLDAPFSLFLNADPATLDQSSPERPTTRYTLLVEVTEKALIARPEAMLRALTRLRSAGWGIALDDVGADSRSLALMSVLYPDVIKLDLRLLARRSPEDRARIVTAVGAEAERRHASVLAEGIDSDEQLAAARAFGAMLGQGYLLGTPEPLPEPLPPPGRPLRLPGGGGDPFGAAPWERVTNWRRPSTGSRRLAAEAASVIIDHAAELGDTAMVLAALADESHGPGSVARYGWLPDRVAFVGVLGAGDSLEGTGVRSGSLPPGDALRGTGTLVALGPDFAACFVVREIGPDEWSFAITYDRDTVVQCALPLMARMEPLER